MSDVVTVDLDGTLLNNANEIIGGKATIDALYQLVELGAKFVINTGRLDHDILNVSQKFNLPSDIRMSQNGAVLQTDRDFKATIMNRQEALKVWDYLKTSPLRVELNTVTNRYWLSDRPKDFVRELYESQIMVDDFDIVIRHQPVALFLLIGDEPNIVAARKYISAHFTNVYPVQTSASSLEILPYGVSKGHTLRQAFPQDRIFGVGDSENDFTVFDAADYAYYISDQPRGTNINVANITEALHKIIEVIQS